MQRRKKDLRRKRQRQKDVAKVRLAEAREQQIRQGVEKLRPLFDSFGWKFLVKNVERPVWTLDGDVAKHWVQKIAEESGLRKNLVLEIARLAHNNKLK